FIEVGHRPCMEISSLQRGMDLVSSSITDHIDELLDLHFAMQLHPKDQETINGNVATRVPNLRYRDGDTGIGCDAAAGGADLVSVLVTSPVC
ncbi:unnamed protein product, partial [Symbiodinium sp. CCMP2592]